MIVKTTWEEAKRYGQSHDIRMKLMRGGARDRHLANEPEKMRWEWDIAISLNSQGESKLWITLRGRVWHWNHGKVLAQGVIPTGVQNHPWVKQYGTKTTIPSHSN